MQSGRSTPHPQAPVQDVAMRASASLQTMMKSMAEMHKAMPKWEDVPPTTDANENDVLELQKQIDTAKNNDMKETAKIKRLIGESLYSNIREKLRQDIQEQIKLEVKRQTQLQVDQRIAEYIPISLKTQLLETEVKTDEVSASLKSSTARKSNSAITIVHNIDDPLGVVLTKNGEKSTVYPQDLRSFYGYEPSDVEKLLADYGLEACDSPTENSNRLDSLIKNHHHVLWVAQRLAYPGSRGRYSKLTRGYRK